MKKYFFITMDNRISLYRTLFERFFVFLNQIFLSTVLVRIFIALIAVKYQSFVELANRNIVV